MSKRNAKDSTIPPYVESVLQLAKSTRIKPGSVVHIEVVHARDCALLTARGDCNCSASVRQVMPS